ncbi:kinase-like domain-containing protein [Aspergillus ambiguus]|uniref:aminoglycoside phosphotransferase family protein n=1 Tax=Aspergillus ambiguus TaxID=176160 RepID=UPI003CCCF6B7
MVHKTRKANIFTYAKFNVAALLSLAYSIRGKECSCDETQRPKSGSLNWVIFLSFEDGVEWVFRSPRRSFGLQEATASEVVMSEVATMKYLGEMGKIPVPEVFSYCATDQNDIEVPYILMSKASGVPLSTYRWEDGVASLPGISDRPQAVLSTSQRRKILRQLGVMHAALSNIRFSEIGSLFMDNNTSYTPRKCLFPSLIWQGRDEFDDTEITRGSFSESRAFYMASINAFLAHSAELPMDHHLFHAPVPIVQEYDSFEEYRLATDRWNDYVTMGSKIESRKNRLDYTLVGISFRDIVAFLSEKDRQTSCDGFPLYHPDISTHNIFVDDNLNITCIIDWAFASSVPPAMLLVCPGLPHPRDGTHFSLLGSFIDGFIAGGGFSGKAALDFSHNDLFWAFFRLVNLDSLQDFYYFSAHSFIDRTGVYPYICHMKGKKEFLEAAEYVSKDEWDEERSRRSEEQYFSCVGPQRHALSRYLTMIEQQNNQFVADKRLWRCIELYLNERDVYMFS